MHILTWKEKHGAAPGVVSPSACLLVDVFFCFNHKLQVGVPAGFDGSIGPAEAANAHQFFLPTFIRSPKNNMTSMDSEPLYVNLHEFHHMFLQQTPIFLTKKNSSLYFNQLYLPTFPTHRLFQRGTILTPDTQYPRNPMERNLRFSWRKQTKPMGS